MTHHHHRAVEHVPHDDMGETALADLLDLDAEALHSYWTDALGWVGDAAAEARCERILDLGAGTGIAALAFARRFPGAELLAVDASEYMLARIRDKAIDLGVADRVHTVAADLDDEWPALLAAPTDLTWASMSLHHLDDPDRTLRNVVAASRPGGLMAVAEFAEQPRFLPDDLGLGRPGFETRVLDALRAEHTHSLPHLGSEWAPRLTAAGFTVVEERLFRIELDPPHQSAVARYAHRWLARLRSGLEPQLAADDRAVLDTLVKGDGPESLLRRTDLRVRGTRTVTLARRPEAAA